MDRHVERDPVEEREVKLAVPDGFALPALVDLGPASITDHGDERLRAVYWDSDDLALVNAGVGLRHRNGTWAYKGRSRWDGDAVVREEVEVAAGGGTIPPELRARVQPWVDPAALHPVAELDTVRHRVDIEDGGRSVELVHDRVKVCDGERVVAAFEEVEVEFALASHELADAVVRLLVGTGAVVDGTPKYLRALHALGHHPPVVST